MKQFKYIDLAGFKSFEDGNGGFEGYANNFGSLDSYGDITVPGCFKAGLEEFIEKGWSAPDHDWGVANEIGIIASAHEDDQGLFVRVEFHPTPDAQSIRAKIKNRLDKKKAVRLSIGYSTEDERIISGHDAVAYLRHPTEAQKAACMSRSRVRLLLKAKLYEVSPVSVPAEPNARVTAVKSAGQDSEKGAFAASVEGAEHRGLMVGCYLSKEAAGKLAAPGGEPAEDLHVTLAYCGDISAVEDLTIAKAMVAVEGLAQWKEPLTGKVSGIGRFNASNTTDGNDVIWAGVDMPGLADLHLWLSYVLSCAGLPPRSEHGFIPHITLAYVEPGAPSPVESVESVALRFDALTITIGGERTVLPLRGYSHGGCSPYFYLGDEASAETKTFPPELMDADAGVLAGLQFADHSSRVLTAVEGLSARAAILDLRAKAGRTISAGNCERLKLCKESLLQALTHMQEMSGELDGLIEMAEPKAQAVDPERVRMLRVKFLKTEVAGPA